VPTTLVLYVANNTLPTLFISLYPETILFGSAGNLNQMNPKLRLYRAVDFFKVSAEDNFIKSFDHLARGELAKLAELPLGKTSANAPVQRVFAAPNISVPVGNSKLKELGFTKLVKRDKGVYENVTATGSEKKYMKAGDPNSLPDVKRKIRD